MRIPTFLGLSSTWLTQYHPSTVVFFNTKFSYWFQNAVGIVKVLTLIFIAITGLVVLGGNTRVADPQANFRHAFEGKATPYGLTNALVKIIFSYAGYENAFNVVNEVRVSGIPELRTADLQGHI